MAASRVVTDSKFFAEIKRRSSERSAIVVKDFADRMLEILKNRRSLGAASGRYPRWSPTKLERHISLKSFKKWNAVAEEKQKYRTKFSIFNPAMNKKEKFNYPSVLIDGTGFPNSWKETLTRGLTKKGETPKIVSGSGGRIFSKQMPQGLDAWLLRKRSQLIVELSDMLKTRNRY